MVGGGDGGGWGGLLFFLVGSGMFRCGKRILESISQFHLVSSNASLYQYLRDPYRSMLVSSGKMFPIISVSRRFGYSKRRLLTMETLFVVSGRPLGRLWLTQAVRSCLGMCELLVRAIFPMNWSWRLAMVRRASGML